VREALEMDCDLKTLVSQEEQMLTHFTATDLAYNIVERLLVGRIDDTTISAIAVSGGRAGSKIPGIVNPMLANTPTQQDSRR
jgi:hypothetical protein